MTFQRLLAKSLPACDGIPEPCTLRGHLAAVHGAACVLARESGEAQLSAIGLSPAVWLPRFERIVRLAAAVHDLGKANDHFQGVVWRRRSAPQGLRHEWLAYLLLDEGA